MPRVSIGDAEIHCDERGSGLPQLVVLGTGGHLAASIVPDEYNAAVGAFLREHRAL